MGSRLDTETRVTIHAVPLAVLEHEVLSQLMRIEDFVAATRVCRAWSRLRWRPTGLNHSIDISNRMGAHFVAHQLPLTITWVTLDHAPNGDQTLAAFPALYSLTLRACTAVGACFHLTGEALRFAPLLVILDLTAYDGDGFPDAALRHVPQLQELGLAKQMTDATLRHVPTLRLLVMGRNMTVTDAGLAAVPMLTVLALGWNVGMTPAALVHVPRLSLLKTGLNRNFRLSDMGSLPNLRIFYFYNDKICARGRSLNGVFVTEDIDQIR
jgi:hypothetical protein